jgi:glucokinase
VNQLFLALDYGGTKHTAAILRSGERVWAAHSLVFSPPGANAAYDQATLLRMARELLVQVPGRLSGIGVSFGGPVDATRGLVRLSHHVPGWEDVQLGAMLQREFGAPASVDNDANVAALGEWRFGAGQGANSLFYLTVSTGVGGGWVLNGRVWNGADGMAGEIGHCVVRPGGTPCVCGKKGCVEAEACGPSLARKAAAWLTDNPGASSLLREYSGNRPATLTGEIVARAAADGDRIAVGILDGSAEALGQGIGIAVNLINPERVVLGGGVTKAGDRWWDGVRRAARAQALPQARVEIVSAALSDDAPLWGAAALAMAAMGSVHGNR